MSSCTKNSLPAWPWKVEDEQKWGKLIIGKYGALTDLDRKLHRFLLTKRIDQSLSNKEYGTAMRRRMLVEPSEAIGKSVASSVESSLKHTDNCAICGKFSRLRCGKCNRVYYCGAEHQKIDWKAHKKICAPKPPSLEEQYDIDTERYGGINGFTDNQCDALMEQGIKPWDDDAANALYYLEGGDDDYYDENDDYEEDDNDEEDEDIDEEDEDIDKENV